MPTCGHARWKAEGRLCPKVKVTPWRAKASARRRATVALPPWRMAVSDMRSSPSPEGMFSRKATGKSPARQARAPLGTVGFRFVACGEQQGRTVTMASDADHFDYVIV